MLRIPISKAEGYRGRTMTSRLQLQSDDQVTDDLIRYLAAFTHDSTAQKLAKSGIIAVYSVVQGLMKTGDTRSSNELVQATELPPTAKWRLQTPSSYCFENPSANNPSTAASSTTHTRQIGMSLSSPHHSNRFMCNEGIGTSGSPEHFTAVALHR